jgi:hypothetical protein
MMYKRLILLLGVLLSSHVPAAAQTPGQQIVRAQEQVAATLMIDRVSAPLFASSLTLSENPEKSAGHFSYQFAGVYEPDPSLMSLAPMRQVDTLFLTQLSVPLVQLWAGRLRFDAFASTINMRNMQLGPSAAGGLQDFLPARQNYPGGPHSVDLYGVSLTFHFGRDAQIGRPTQIWQSIARIIGGAR